MKVFLSGGSGFVGRHLLRRLRAEGHKLVALARSPAAAEAVLREGADPWRGELDDLPRVAQALRHCDAVVHAAAHLKFWGPWQQFEAANVGLTHALLDAARSVGVPNFIHVGAASVVMRTRGPMLNVDERAPLVDARWLPYSTTKARAERAVLQAATTAFRTVSLRPPFIWGPGDAVDRELGAAIRRRRFGWFSGGHFPYATCHVANLAQAVVLALRGDVSGEALFVSDGEPVDLRVFLSRRLAVAGLPVTRASVPTAAAWAVAGALEFACRALRLETEQLMVRETVRLMGYPFTVDIGRARKRLGYVPLVSVDQGLEQFAATHPGSRVLDLAGLTG
ncbi:MAG: NAD-dependent epimerase/dehydratase family protein [Rubrivivax sp.]